MKALTRILTKFGNGQMTKSTSDQVDGGIKTGSVGKVEQRKTEVTMMEILAVIVALLSLLTYFCLPDVGAGAFIRFNGWHLEVKTFFIVPFIIQILYVITPDIALLKNAVKLAIYHALLWVLFITAGVVGGLTLLKNWADKLPHLDNLRNFAKMDKPTISYFDMGLGFAVITCCFVCMSPIIDLLRSFLHLFYTTNHSLTHHLAVPTGSSEAESKVIGQPDESKSSVKKGKNVTFGDITVGAHVDNLTRGISLLMDEIVGLRKVIIEMNKQRTIADEEFFDRMTKTLNSSVSHKVETTAVDARVVDIEIGRAHV